MNLQENEAIFKMKLLTDLLKEAGIELGKVYTDKDMPSFRVSEASDKIQVQGLGVYDHKSLSRKVGKMVDDLSKRNRKGNHTGLGKRQLGTLAAMWEALAKYEEKK